MKKIFTISVLTLLLVSNVNAQEEKNRAAFTIISEPLQSDSSVPKVYEYELPEDVYPSTVEVFSETGETFIPHEIRTDIEQLYERSHIETSLTGEESGLNDNVATTSVDFKLPESGSGMVDITHVLKKPLTTDKYYLQLASNVQKPKTIAIFAVNEKGVEEVVLAPKRISSLFRNSAKSFIIKFPKTTSGEWRVQLTYTQPLRIEELGLVPDGALTEETRYVRFLHKPKHKYKVYANPDRKVSVETQYRVDLINLQDIRSVERVLSFEGNPVYVVSDDDEDGVPDRFDNCPIIANSDQLDIDGNGTGDVCDDFDVDKIMNSMDNCPNDPNYNQADEDADGVGDVCDYEDSRLTEKYAWIPWVGIGFAGLVLLVMFMVVLKRPDNVLEQETLDTDDGEGGP